jgi:hypothetical protein
MNARLRQLSVGGTMLAVCLASASCGDVVRQGRSPAFLVIDSLLAASGATPGQLGVPLNSDVLTKSTVNDDLGQVTLRMLLKDQGGPGVLATPSVINSIKITRYRVEFMRADGRKTQGIDVPYAFDGGVTATITGAPVDVPFEIVRHNAKLEAPLATLVSQGGRVIISTIAVVTFYGKDLAGNDVQVSGNISVNFADFADPS